MSDIPTQIEFPEPERYELSEAPRYTFEVSRREFVQTLGAGLFISVALPEILAQRAGGTREATVEDRLHIGADGTITVFTSKVEVGQGSRTQLTQAAAEELRVPISRIRLIMADSAVGPNDGGTAGSRTTPSTVPAVRKGCAAARQLLIETAAKKFGVDAKSLSIEEGRIVGREFGYNDLAGDTQTAQRQPAAGVEIREVSRWTVLGTSVPRVDANGIVTGAHRYPSDIVRPGMLYGKVLRPAAYNSELTRVNLDVAKKSDGVVAVRDGNFVGVAARNSFLAEQARQELAKTAEWKPVVNPSSDELFEYLQSHTSSSRPRREVKGSPDDLLKPGAKIFRNNYNIAYIQHAPMEPRAAVAEWHGDKLTVWTGTQQPQRVREDLARAFQITTDRIRVIVPDTGGGFGGKHSGETAVEAARLAKEAKKPVLLRWTREEEFTWAYFRPAGVIKIAATLDDAGRISAWEQINFNSGASAIATPYDVPNTATEFRSCDAPLRAGSYRALASTANTFAREAMMDEIAASANVNPLEFRLRHLKNDRLRNVLVTAAEQFRWNSRWKKNSSTQRSGIGLACGTEKGSYVACCTQVDVDSKGNYRLSEVVEAFECGAVQNPRNLQAQVEGCIIQGLGGAMREEIRFKDGKILNPHFSEYQVPRFTDVPEIQTVLLDRKDLPSVGAGETPIICIAPAIANALFNAVQVRIRSMPLRTDSIQPA
jgi:CO/xanthine dehydrogenase Mo-binding subunit